MERREKNMVRHSIFKTFTVSKTLPLSEATVFKLSNVSLEYLQWISHFIGFCLYLYREAKRNITAALYVGEWSIFRPFSYTEFIHSMQIFK
jgi:hypothetical protein